MQIGTIAQLTTINATQIQQVFFVAYQEEANLLQLDDFPPLTENGGGYSNKRFIVLGVLGSWPTGCCSRNGNESSGGKYCWFCCGSQHVSARGWHAPPQTYSG